MPKLIKGARIPIFGHAKHTVFECNSSAYIDVPDTYSAAFNEEGRGSYRIEVVWATDHNRSIALRMFDPANPQSPPNWEFEFKGGDAPNTWWNFATTNVFGPGDDPWPRQNTLQMKTLDGSQAFLGSVVIVVEDFTPKR